MSWPSTPAPPSPSPPRSPLTLAQLEHVESALRKATGLTFTEATRGSLPRSVVDAAASLSLPLKYFLQRLYLNEPACLEALIDRAVIGETYFFRHPEHHDVLSNSILPRLVGRPSITVWSAGCSTGEEPYGLAMTLLEAGRSPGRDRILATDLSEASLRLARAGSYGEWALRRTSNPLRARHFVKTQDRFQVSESIRRSVSFSRHNLITDAPPAQEIDLIVCRNVLIYFSPEVGRAVTRRLLSALAPGGWLLLGVAERPLADGCPDVERVTLGETILFRPRAVPIGRATPAVQLAPAANQVSSGEAKVEPFAAARIAASVGDLALAERLAREAARVRPTPEVFLLLAALADAESRLTEAESSLRRALYLDPQHAQAHAVLAALYLRLGRREEAERARANALRVLEGLTDSAELPGLEPVTAGALRSALAGRQGAVPS